MVTDVAVNHNIRYELDYDTIIFDNPSFDNSIVGVTTEGRAVYDYWKMVAELMEDDNISEQDAIDWIEYNTIRSIPYAGEMAPVVIFTFKGCLYGKQ